MQKTENQRDRGTKLVVVMICFSLLAVMSMASTHNARAEIVLPRIIGTTPYDGEENTSLNFTMEITFSKPMNTTSVNESFSINPAIEGVFEWNDNNTIFYFKVHGWYKNDTWHTVTISGAAQDMEGLTLDGNNNTYAEGSPEDDYTFRFFTDTPPQISSYYLHTVALILTGILSVSFTLNMNTVSVASGLTVTGPNSGYSLSWVVNSLIITFNLRGYPSGFERLNYNTAYSIKFNSNIVKALNDEFLDGDKDGVAEGSPTDDYYINFTTGHTLQTTALTSGAIGLDKTLDFGINKDATNPMYNPPTIYNVNDSTYMTVTYSDGYFKKIITPQNYWRGNRTYRVDVPYNMYITYGGNNAFYFDGDMDEVPELNSQDAVTYYFDTYPTPKATTPTPTINATLNQQLVINFNYPMQTSTLGYTITPTFTPDFSYSWSNGDKTLTLTPNSNFQWDTAYTFKILGTTKAKAQSPFNIQVGLDGDGDEWVELSPADDYTFSFHTVADNLPPSITAYGQLLDGGISYRNDTTIILIYNDGVGMGIDSTNITISINGEDYTVQSIITDETLTLYLDDLDNGFYNVTVTVYDLAGNTAVQEWTFEIHVYTLEQTNTEVIELGLGVVLVIAVVLGGAAIIMTGLKTGRIGGRKK